ncbi:putative alcohol dehydrogenase [Xylogone sp. PMI_703]|nr:putative alcohol dehydrogenase [Xylogone sp. PMI_703]
MSQNASFLRAIGASLVIGQRPIPSPGQHQLLIKNHAIAINPVENMMQDTGYIVHTLPLILGTDISGIIEAIGPEVTKFQKGDRVAGFACAIGTKDPNEAGYQEYTILQENASVKLPDHITFEQGAMMPMAVATAGVGIFVLQGIPRKVSPDPSPHKFIYLVWGAGSSVGTVAVQILRRIGFIVFATAGMHHHSYIKSLGASEVFDYKDPNIVQAIVARAKAIGKSVTYCFAAISKDGGGALAAKVLAHYAQENRPVKLCTTLPYPTGEEKIPPGIEVVMTNASLVGMENKEFGSWLFNDFLGSGLASGECIPSPLGEVVDGGLAVLQTALNKLKAGVSGKKLIVTL